MIARPIIARFAAAVLYTAAGASASALVWFVVIPFLQFFRG